MMMSGRVPEANRGRREVERVLPELRREYVNEISNALLHASDPNVERSLAWRKNVAWEYLNHRAWACLEATWRTTRDQEGSDYVAIFERLPDLGLVWPEVGNGGDTSGDPNVRTHEHREQCRDRKPAVTVQLCKFFQDVVSGGWISLPESCDWVLVPSLVRLYRLDLGHVVVAESLQLAPCPAPKGFGRAWLPREDWEAKVLPIRWRVGLFSQSGDVPDDVVPRSPKIAYDLTEVSGGSAEQFGVNQVSEDDLAIALRVAVGFKAIAAAVDDRLTGDIQRIHVFASAIPPGLGICEGWWRHRFAGYVSTPEDATWSV